MYKRYRLKIIILREIKGIVTLKPMPPISLYHAMLSADMIYEISEGADFSKSVFPRKLFDKIRIGIFHDLCTTVRLQGLSRIYRNSSRHRLFTLWQG